MWGTTVDLRQVWADAQIGILIETHPSKRLPGEYVVGGWVEGSLTVAAGQAKAQETLPHTPYAGHRRRTEDRLEFDRHPWPDLLSWTGIQAAVPSPRSVAAATEVWALVSPLLDVVSERFEMLRLLHLPGY